jgi:hypothetical protein
MLSTVDGQQTTAHLIELQTFLSLVTRVNGVNHTIKKAYPEWNRLFFSSIFQAGFTRI